MNPAKWEEQFDSAFNWADQVKDSELERWRVMYSFTPDDIKAFIRETLLSHQAEMVRKLDSLRLEMPDHECVLGYCPHYPRIEQNNQVLDAAIALIKGV